MVKKDQERKRKRELKERMALQIDITTSIGVYDCTIEEQPNKNTRTYAITIVRRNAEASVLYKASFEMSLDRNGIPRVLHTIKYPLPAYWLEIERVLGNYILANT